MCAINWHNRAVSLHQQNEDTMNTNDTLSRLSAMFATEDSFMAMVDLVDDLGLELKSILTA